MATTTRIKRQIKQKIEEKRGRYTQERRKKLRYFKYHNQMSNYYKQKIPMMPRLEPIVANLKWWQRIYVALILGFKRLWRKLFGKLKKERLMI